MQLQFVGCGDAFGSGGRFNTCFHLVGRNLNTLIDCGATSLVSMNKLAISRNEIIDKLWGEDKLGNQRTVDNMIVHLRQSLGDTNSQFIRSVRGIGYQWSAA